jgi:hypothetical protein
MDQIGGDLGTWAFVIVAFIGLGVMTILFLASRYKRCPSDKILVIYGKVGEGQSSNCIHGGGTLVWPLIQDYEYLSLTPLTINIDLKGALSMQNIRINVPSTFTVGISTSTSIMNNAAERLLGLPSAHIEDMAREIIFGQLRLTVASLTIEQINQDRESFLDSIRKNVEPELNKIGLYLINVNITDITDTSDYIAMPSSNEPTSAFAAAIASRVFPVPPGPVMVTMRACVLSSSTTAAMSSARPTSGVAGAGGMRASTGSRTGVGSAAGAAPGGAPVSRVKPLGVKSNSHETAMATGRPSRISPTAMRTAVSPAP